MKAYIRIYLGFISISLVFLLSCEFEESPSVTLKETIVSCFLSNDSYTHVYLSKYSDFSDTIFYGRENVIENASIKISGGDEETDSLRFLPWGADILDPGGYYLSQYSIRHYNETYHLQIDIPGIPSITAEDELPSPVPIISIDTIIIPESETSPRTLNCLIHFKDPSEITNYYSITGILLQDYDSLKPQLEAQIKSDDPIIEGSINHYRSSYCFFSDTVIKGKDVYLTCSIDLSLLSNYVNGAIDIELNSISHEYYQYLHSIARYLKAKDDIYSEPARVYSNIKNGMGIFACFSRSSKRFYFPKEK